MLSYDDALAQILAAAPPPTSDLPLWLHNAVGRVLTFDASGLEDLPPFANSAVDGFAVRAADCVGAAPDSPVTLIVAQTIAAGKPPAMPVLPGQTARILTGAMMPDGADAIVMVEDSRIEMHDGVERVHLTDPGSASHIRAAGSDLPAGALALEAGTVIDAGAVGLLAALNQAAVHCCARPRVGIITTGDELVPVGGDPYLAPGQIRDSNGPALAAAVHAAGGIVAKTLHAADTLKSTRAALAACARRCDLILSSGGVSVGEFDYVKAAVETMGTLDFWRIAIKPGKPLAFGSVGGVPFVGLPGNPVSSLVTFELFVRPLLRAMGGYQTIHRRRVTATLAESLPHTPGRREFVRTRLDWQGDTFVATPTGAQGSHRLSSLQAVDAYLIAHESRSDYAAGERMEAMLLGG